MKQTIPFLIFFFVVGFAAATTYTENTATDCKGRICSTSIYPVQRYAMDSQGEWGDAGDIFTITKNQDDITFGYHPQSGTKTITFEAGVIFSGGYLSFQEVKQNYPQVDFSFPVEEKATHKKYTLIISNVPEAQQSNVEAVTLTYKSHDGFFIDELSNGKKSFFISKIVELGFGDLIENGFDVRINKSEKRLYIENLVFVDDSLILDPTLRFNSTANDGYLTNNETTWAVTRNEETSNTATTGASLGASVWNRTQEGYYHIDRIFMKFVTDSIPTGANITSAALYINSTVIVTRAAANTLTDHFALESLSGSGWGDDLDNADYDICNSSTPTYSGATKNASEFTTNTYEEWVLNAAAIDIINGSSEAHFCIRHGRDINSTPPTNTSLWWEIISFASSETDTPPYLNVTYEIPTSAATFATNAPVANTILRVGLGVIVAIVIILFLIQPLTRITELDWDLKRWMLYFITIMIVVALMIVLLSQIFSIGGT